MPDHYANVTVKWPRALVVWTMSGRRLSTRNGDLSRGNKPAVQLQLDFLGTMQDLCVLAVLPTPVVVKRVKSKFFYQESLLNFEGKGS